MFGYISGSPFLLQDGFGLSPQAFSACFACNGIGIVLATWLGRALLRVAGPAGILTAGLVQAGAGAILLLAAVTLHLGLWPVLVGFFVMVSAVGLALPHSSALAMDRHRRIAGAASAIFGVIQWALAALAAPLVGIGNRTAGTAVGVTAVIAIGLASAALALARLAPDRTA
jgi:DHA1 family bicyclomycin/chloramphenicol resistance-like MFS transporter